MTALMAMCNFKTYAYIWQWTKLLWLSKGGIFTVWGFRFLQCSVQSLQ